MDKSDLLVQNICNNIFQYRKKKLEGYEKVYILRRLRQLDPREYDGKKLSEISSALSNIFLMELPNVPKAYKEDPIDIHDKLNEFINSDDIKQKNPNSSSVTDLSSTNNTSIVNALLLNKKALQKAFAPDVIYKKATILLDRKYQSEDANNSTEFKWNISHISSIYNPANTVATTEIISNIHKIIMYPFKFINLDHVANSRQRLSVEILEFNSQGCILPYTNRRSHFLFNYTPNGSFGSLASYNIEDIGQCHTEFEFSEPITDVRSITLRFGNPEQIIQVDPDYLYANIIDSGSNTTKLIFDQPHKCQINDLIFINNFTTTNPITDAIQISALNNPNGLRILSIPDFSSIIVDVNISTIVGTIVNNKFYVYLDSKRFLIKLDIIYI